MLALLLTHLPEDYTIKRWYERYLTILLFDNGWAKLAPDFKHKPLIDLFIDNYAILNLEQIAKQCGLCTSQCLQQSIFLGFS